MGIIQELFKPSKETISKIGDYILKALENYNTVEIPKEEKKVEEGKEGKEEKKEKDSNDKK